ncbi:hypothetical protein E3N88_31644 [Mikania micrantha]|uniref:Retrovirus-related Pol polyprotein from transposon TNT 1-94-like beta-barrel domain-containing protein n=1 Tax=Mikania micrantha TaxID=192012 RepID=A0A5N6M648_9ASTR|nr:hypothetical protein E3N88_31644 [Mikania micrantha]
MPIEIMLMEDKVFLNHHKERSIENNDMWYLDNGASNHMTGRKEVFADLDQCISGSVRFGDDSRVQIKGKGTVLFQCKNAKPPSSSTAEYVGQRKASRGQTTTMRDDEGQKREYDGADQLSLAQ